MTRVHYRFIVCLLIFSAALGVFGLNDNYDSYCGKNFAFAQNNCPLLCASGTDQECRNMLGEQYKCFHSTGCSERIKNRGLITHPNSRRTEGEGVCASSLKGAVMGCDYRMACSGDLDCGVAELCYSDICGNPLMILQSEFLFTMIRVERPMDQAAERTFTKALSIVLEQTLKANNIVLDSVSIMDSRQTGTILYVNVRIMAQSRPKVQEEQNLGQIIINAFNSGAQQEFTASLGNNYYSGVIGVFLSLKKNESRPAPPPTPAPTLSIKIETLPPNILPATVVEPPTTPPAPDESSSSQPPTVSTSSPTISPPPTFPILGPFYLAVLIQNTPYQTLYMEDTDFDKFAEVFASAVNTQLEDSFTDVKGVTLGYHQLISLGNRVTATEINFGYQVSSNLTEAEIGKKVARAVGRNRQDILSSLQSLSDSFPYFLEVDEIQAQNIASIGEPGSTATLPQKVPEKPITQPPTPSPTSPPTILQVEEEEEPEEEEAGITVADLLASDAEKAQAAKDEAIAMANLTNFNRNETDAVEVINASISDPNETDELGGLRIGVYAGIGGGVLLCFIAIGFSYLHIRKRRRLLTDKGIVEEGDVEGDFKSKKSAPKWKFRINKGNAAAATDVEGGNELSTANDSLPDIPHDTAEQNEPPDVGGEGTNTRKKFAPKWKLRMRRGSAATDAESGTELNTTNHASPDTSKDTSERNDSITDIEGGEKVNTTNSTLPDGGVGDDDDDISKEKVSDRRGTSLTSLPSLESSEKSAAGSNSPDIPLGGNNFQESVKSAAYSNSPIIPFGGDNFLESMNSAADSNSPIIPLGGNNFQGSVKSAAGSNSPNMGGDNFQGSVKSAAGSNSPNMGGDNFHKRSVKTAAGSNLPNIPVGGNDFQRARAARRLNRVANKRRQPKPQKKRKEDVESSDSDSSSSDDDSSSSSDESEDALRYIRKKLQVAAMDTEFSEVKTKSISSSKSRKALMDEYKKSSRKDLGASSGKSRRKMSASTSRRNPGDERKLSSGKSRRNLGDEKKLSSGKSKRNIGDQRKLTSGKSRRNLVDERKLADERKLSSGQSRRRGAIDEASGKKSKDRPPKTARRRRSRSKESLSSFSSRKSKKENAGDPKREGKLSSEKSRRTHEDREEKRRERRRRTYSPVASGEHDDFNLSYKSFRSKPEYGDRPETLSRSARSDRNEDGDRPDALSRSARSDRTEDGDRPETLSRSVRSDRVRSDRRRVVERRKAGRKKDTPDSPKRDLQRSKSLREVDFN